MPLPEEQICFGHLNHADLFAEKDIVLIILFSGLIQSMLLSES